MTMAGTDPNDDTVSDTSVEPVVLPLGSGPKYSAVLATAVTLLRSQPSLFVPFILASLFGAASTIIRIESPYPVGITTFPDGGLVRLFLPVVPRLEPVTEIDPTIFLGLKPRFLAVLVGWQLLVGIATALAFASSLWIAADDTSGVVPPAERSCWLVAYVVLIDGALFGTLYAISGWAIQAVGFAVVSLLVIAPIQIGLFLTPAYIVFDGKRPVSAAAHSLNYAGAIPFSLLFLMLGLGYSRYVLTGTATLVSSSTGGVVLATASSVIVTGPAHTAIVAALYRFEPR